MISIIDYGMGNLHSVQKAFEQVGAVTKLVTTGEEIGNAEKLVLPGVGAFRDAVGTLQDRGLAEPIRRAAAEGKWFLGVCLGLQLLFDVSYEEGTYQGLGIIAGEVKRFDFSARQDERDLKIPHMGWNALQIKSEAPLYQDVPQGAYVYFVHSYHVVPEDTSVIASTTDHGGEFVSSIWRENVMATQFHPEKSQRVGLHMLKNFAAI